LLDRIVQDAAARGPASWADEARGAAEERRRLPATRQGTVSREARLLGRRLGVRAHEMHEIVRITQSCEHSTRVRADLGPAEADERHHGVRQHQAGYKLWRRLDRIAPTIWQVLRRTRWDHAQTSGHLDATPAGRILLEFETLAATQVAMVIKETVTRILSGLTVAAVGTAALMTSHLCYMFQGRPFWLTFDWLVLGSVCAVSIWVIVALERDPVLSVLWKTVPGQITWTGGFVFRAAGYALVPMLSAFATFFPEVGSNALRWIEPLRGVLP
jgi:hypothetical protein